MSSSRRSVFGGWWARLFGRADSAHTLAAVSLESSAATLVPAVPLPEKKTEMEKAEPSPPGVNVREENPEALKEMLLLETWPANSAPAVTENAGARARTLEALSHLRQIPALQSLAQGFMQALNRPEVEMDEVVGAISKDPALCVRVLRLANSVMVASEQRIEDLDTAVRMLGLTTVRKTAHAVFTLRDAKQERAGFDWRQLWLHALATAAIAEELEERLHAVENSQLHLAGLLHDVGKIVLATIAPEEYRTLLLTAWHEDESLEELERRQFGVDHREAGVLFARHNGLPDVVVQAIAHHDRPEQAETHAFEAALVALANYLSKAHGLGFSGARLRAADGEFENLSAWAVVAEKIGVQPDVAALEAQLGDFITKLRLDLRELRDGS